MLVGLGGISDYSSTITSAALANGLDPSLLTAVIQAESNGNSNAVSPVGAQGLMQLMPATAAMLGVSNSFDPTQNINAGAKYLSQLIKQFGDIPTALAAYNWGPGNVATYTTDSWPTETVNYVNRILGSLSGNQSTNSVSSPMSVSSNSFDWNSIIPSQTNGSDLGMILLVSGIGLLVWRLI